MNSLETATSDATLERMFIARVRVTLTDIQRESGMLNADELAYVWHAINTEAASHVWGLLKDARADLVVVADQAGAIRAAILKGAESWAAALYTHAKEINQLATA